MSDLQPGDVIGFWFGADPKRWFEKSDEFDAQIRDRFGGAVVAAGDGALDRWQETPEGALALVLMLDQFTRNIYRGDARTWASDAKAIAISEAAIANGFDMALPEIQRRFLYMPYMHSEDPAMQARSAGYCADHISDEKYREYTRHHADIVARFGRFPHRNAILGRRSTPEEIAYLEEDGFKG
jgi:uncharacterized protein (DUF924 family)